MDTYELGVEDGLSFVAMEWVDGLSLKELIHTAVPPLPIALSIALDICRGLSYAHQLQGESGPLGLVHLDLKPGNILVGWDGSVKVADFGIAQLTGLATGDVTVTAGTPAFVTGTGGASNGRCSLRCVHARRCPLRVVYGGDTVFAGCQPLGGRACPAHHRTHASATVKTSDIHPSLVEVLQGCLTVEVERRLSSVSEVAEALGAYNESWNRVCRWMIGLPRPWVIGNRCGVVI